MPSARTKARWNCRGRDAAMEEDALVSSSGGRARRAGVLDLTLRFSSVKSRTGARGQSAARAAGLLDV